MDLKEGFVIASEYQKKEILKNVSDFKNYIFISYNDLMHKIYGTISKSAIFDLMNEYFISYDLAHEFIKYIPFVENKTYGDLKLDSLVSAKNFLEKKNRIKKDEFFLYRLPQFPITFLENHNTKQDKSLKAFLKDYTEVIEIKNQTKNYNPKVYEFESIDDELYFVCNEIVNLNEKGIPYSKIHLVNLNNDYLNKLKRLSLSYKIPFDFKSDKNILHTSFSIKLFELMKEKKTFDEILESLPDSNFIDSFISLVKDYELKDKDPSLYLEFFRRELKNISYSKKIYEDMVDISDEIEYEEDDFVFYLGLNQGVSPRIYKDEEYLNDKELEILNLPTSYEKNKEERLNLCYLLKNQKNISISYSKKIGTKALDPSLIISYLNLEIENKNSEYGYSLNEDSIRLAKALSIYDKIRDKDEALEKYSIKDIKYKTFDNKFKGINKKNMQERFNKDKPVSFAYSNMKTYFECPFHYYADRILKLNEFDSTTATRLGTYSHAVMEDSYKEDFDFEKSILENKTKGLENLSPDDYRKDEFYFDQMKSVLSSLLEFNRKHEELSSLKNVLCEAHVVYTKDSLLFHGYIDKLMYQEIDGEIYAAIIDYKTGKDYITLNNVYDGFHLQLPSYMFLLSKYEKFAGKKIHIIGIYLQKVNMIALDNTIDLVAQREKAFRLQGYTIKDISLIPLLDPTFQASEYINGLKVTKSSGDFGAYSKVVTKDEEDFLINLVEELINTAYNGVMDAKFDIAPKKINLEDQSCRFCKYKDICFKTYKDYVYLDEKEFPKKEE